MYWVYNMIPFDFDANVFSINFHIDDLTFDQDDKYQIC